MYYKRALKNSLMIAIIVALAVLTSGPFASTAAAGGPDEPASVFHSSHHHVSPQVNWSE